MTILETIVASSPRFGPAHRLLADDPNLLGWQSGVLFADWTAKPSYNAFKRAIHEANSRRVNCAKLKTRIQKLGGRPGF